MLPAAVESLSTPVACLNLDGRVLDCNAAFARWLQLSVRRLRGVHVSELDAEDKGLAELLADLSPDLEPLCRQRVLLALGPGRGSFCTLWLKRVGEVIYLEAHPVDEFPGEDPLKVLPAALSASLKGLAHELRNPLAGLKGAAQLLERRHDSEESRALLAVISEEAQRLQDMLDRFLNPSISSPPRLLNVHGVLERVRQLAEAEAGWAVKLIRDYDPSLPAIWADEDRLIQAVWNLVRNALQAGANNVTLRSRAEHQVTLGDALHRLAIRIEIIDDGHGVPEALVERLFLPLVSGRAEGTGLGLPLAQQIAREHGGSLVYRSRPGHTVFTLMLPVAAETEEAAT